MAVSVCLLALLSQIDDDDDVWVLLTRGACVHAPVHCCVWLVATHTHTRHTRHTVYLHYYFSFWYFICSSNVDRRNV